MLVSEKELPAKLSLSVSLSIGVHVLILIIVILVIYLQPNGAGLPLSASSPVVMQATMVSTKALTTPAPMDSKIAKSSPVRVQKAGAATLPQAVEKTKPQAQEDMPRQMPLVTQSAEIKAKPPIKVKQKVQRHATPQKQTVDSKNDQLKKQRLAEKRAAALKALGQESLTEAVSAQKAAQEAQQAAVAAEKLASAQDAYKSQISSTVAGAWINPFQNSNQMQLLVAVTIDAQGNVMDTKVTQSSGNDIFDRQALLAIHKAAPFTPPPLADGQTQFTFYIKFLNNDTVGVS